MIRDPDLLNAAADLVVLHRRGFAGDRQRERRHDRSRAEDDAEELEHRATEVVLDVAQPQRVGLALKEPQQP
jgi:hypothetical protein